MKKGFVIKEVSVEEALKVFPKIKEWDRPEAGKVSYCLERIGDKRYIALAAYNEEAENIGYLIGYERDQAFYCWFAAVEDGYRRMGILTKMMEKFIDYARSLGYDKVTLKTVNNKREMLSYLVKNGWNFMQVFPKDKPILNEIWVEKRID